MPSVAPLTKIKIAIDRGGTFTDCLGITPNGNHLVKLLSVDPANYSDAPTEGIRRLLEWFLDEKLPRGELIDTSRIAWIRMGTTVATNALLERKGEKHAMLITKGFRDLIDIGNQTRPSLFELAIKKPEVLYSKVVEVDERAIVQWHEIVPKDGSLVTPEGDKLVQGVSGELVRIVKPLDVAAVTKDLQDLFDEGYRSIAIVFAHSYTFQDHEKQVAAIARSIGFPHVSVSSELQAMIRIVSRGNSATADAYLTPEIKRYLAQFSKGFKGHLQDDSGCRVSFMQSDGSLVDFRHFSGLKAILSGPAGGVVGYAETSYDQEGGAPVVGFDMGGTSTDVSRYGGQLEHVFETVTAGVTIQSPQLDINTVAAGGGSKLFWRNSMFVVGPDSAGAHPGPACYRKGGPLTVTDANLYLGRLHIDSFPKIFGPSENEPLDYDVTARLFAELTAEINADTGGSLTPEEVACGFINVANETMARPIRALTESRGYSTSAHNLSCFGGAGGQHACAIASTLGIHTVIVHKYSSILSAYGMALADVAVDLTEPSSQIYSAESLAALQPRITGLKAQALQQLLDQGIPESAVTTDVYLNMRYVGSDTALMVLEPSSGDFKDGFLAMHRREFGFVLQAEVLIDDLRVRGTGNGSMLGGVAPRSYAKDLAELPSKPVEGSLAVSKNVTYFEEAGGAVDTPIYRLESLAPGTVVKGPAIILDNTQTLIIHPANVATVLFDHVYIDVGLGPRKKLSTTVVDPIALSIFGHRFMSIADRMGRTLQRTATSLQIKERLDFSCAIFGPDAGLVANAPHIPVHLGSMQYAIQFQAEHLKGQLREGDIIVSNHPKAGGTHLPDITVICPVFEGGEIVFFVAAFSRCATSAFELADRPSLAGLNGNSMPPDSVEIWQEGVSIMSHFLVRDGKFNEEEMIEMFEAAGRYPDCLASRRIQDNIADLRAQCAACSQGAAQIQDLFREYGKETVQFYMREIRNNAEGAVREFFKRTYVERQGKPIQAVDYMDDGTPIALQIDIDPETGSARWDFEGTGLEGYSNLNAPTAVANSAMIYCLRTLIGTDMPLNAGVLAPVELLVPEGTILRPSKYAAVSSGNTETSQRVCDVIFKAFEACAASQGCMNVFHANYQDMAYGETICGGAGAGPTWVGQSGVHINMTNTRITDMEVLEKRFPVLLREFTIRAGSGGIGANNGGNGVHREFEFLMPGMHAMVIGERRVNQPYGMHGGGPGERGCSYWLRKTSDGGQQKIKLKPSPKFAPSVGDRLIIHTPGGGAYGAPTAAPAPTASKPVQFPRANGSIAAFMSMQETN
ncbi:Hydantoinase B/oxoprolinase-domain-containing protein [Leucosporidium creatinivorum]|uniref:Hydantoinase B/oxoprolinase-domain-containing protein n=1 Tax=Leucosporidium creatinivorum TaxID=106004 RepID=A0A1Y2DP48_9BASI|nr:Hydantoinase B/oxoprolinase-domain-containing protein [Leucosporidium creatinivorum]